MRNYLMTLEQKERKIQVFILQTDDATYFYENASLA